MRRVPIDAVTLEYLRLTGRKPERIALVEAYAREQGLFHDPAAKIPAYSDVLTLDLSAVEPSLAGPRRPQDRVPLREAKAHQSADGEIHPALDLLKILERHAKALRGLLLRQSHRSADLGHASSNVGNDVVGADREKRRRVARRR